jgi:phage baseplate assembly protein W
VASLVFDIGKTPEALKKTYYYKDIALPLSFAKNRYGFMERIDVDAIKGSIANIMSWKRGERILNPEFGNPFSFFVNEAMTEDFAQRIQISTKNLIERWEPRISITSVNVETNPDLNEVAVTIHYVIKSLNQADQFLLIAPVG